MNIRKSLLATAAMLAGAYGTAQAEVLTQTVQCGDITARNIVLANTDSLHHISFDLDFSQLDLEHNQAILLTPKLIYPSAAGTDTVELRQVGVYSRSRYYHYLRAGEGMLGREDATVLHTSKDLKRTFAYDCRQQRNPMSPTVRLLLCRKDYGCCGKLEDHQDKNLAILLQDVRFIPDPLYLCPPPAPKSRALNGRANIEFEVNKTDIQRDRANNRAELNKIRTALDSVNRVNGTIDSITIKGFASPDGPYDKNVMLAKGRTEAIADFVQNRYNVAHSLLRTASEPEDWEGFRRLVGESDLPHRQQLLDIADDDFLTPDEKEAEIKTKYPKDYDTMRKGILMRLRHTDYTISYILPVYTSIDTILAVLKRSPGLLSQNEFYQAAETYPVGSEQFVQVLRTAAACYPEDAISCINAANAAMANDNLREAEIYIKHVGESPEANYTRGIYCALTNNFDLACEYFESAMNDGIEKAKNALAQARELLTLYNQSLGK